jgi:hypothetical protein
MGETNTDRVRRVIDAFNRGEPEAALDEAVDDFVMDWSNSIGPLRGVYRGKDEVLQVWSTFMEAFEWVSWEPKEIIEVDESTVVVVNQVRMRGRGSGVDVDAVGAQVWRVTHEGKGRSVKLYQSKAEALEAVRAG